MKSLLFWLFIAQGADIATTTWAVRHNCHEGNAVAVSHLSAAFATKIGGSLVISLSIPKLHRSHPKAADWSVAVPAVAGSVGAGWNTYQIARGACR